MTEGARLTLAALVTRGWTQTTLTEQLGASRGHVSKWLSGDRRPGLRWALEIEKLLGVDPEAWLRDA